MNETLTRLLSGIVYIGLLLLATNYSFDSFFALFGTFLLITTYEFSQLIKINTTIALLISTIVYIGFYFLKGNNSLDIFLLIIIIPIALKLIQLLFNTTASKPKTALKWLFQIGYITLPFVCITKIPMGINGYNPKIIISLFILIWTNDTFAYIVGKSIGKHKLLEKISPKKTIEGFLGGMLFCILAGFLIAKYYINTTVFIWIVIALLVSLFGTIGDLIESKFKRIAGVKDSGKIMPGHGGILDRLDSLIFVAPFIYLFFQILFYTK